MEGRGPVVMQLSIPGDGLCSYVPPPDSTVPGWVLSKPTGVLPGLGGAEGESGPGPRSPRVWAQPLPQQKNRVGSGS